MQPFEFATAQNIERALELARDEPGASFIAGGTTLIDLMKVGVEAPALVIDINALPLNGIEVTTVGVRLGALARMSDVAYDPTIAERFPMISQALLVGASGQLRNMATLGGNLRQRTRCPYFREPTWPCNKRSPGSGCSARTGVHRTQAIFGASDACIATHPSDVAVAFAALDATVRVTGPAGERTIAFDDFHTLPGDHPEIETTLLPGELIVAIDVPFCAAARTSTYVKVRDRASYAFALVSVACGMHVEDGRISAARIALGGVGTKPWRSREAEAALIGAVPERGTYGRAAEAALAAAQPLPDNAFKVPLAKNAIVRALASLDVRA
ncbi:MAG: xanthine dehydrogenase family protein subunit M [Candidatus Eremiobacteraeota bacterium]|nr:xanthine dehydrogenase family protein subunit M [Candidatus Eremiobacteraeota bacterium]